MNEKGSSAPLAFSTDASPLSVDALTLVSALLDWTRVRFCSTVMGTSAVTGAVGGASGVASFLALRPGLKAGVSSTMALGAESVLFVVASVVRGEVSVG